MYTYEEETTVLTPELAIQWLSERQFLFQRSLRRQVVERYANEMTRGTWEPYSTLQVCKVGETVYLTDGQHRAAAVIKSGCAQTFSIIVRHVDSLDDVARIYTRTDKGLLRNIRDDFAALNLADKFDLTPTQLKVFPSALAFINSDFKRSRLANWHPDDRLEMMEEYLESYRRFLDSIQGCSKVMTQRFHRAATLSVGLVTFRYSLLKYASVPLFWKGVAEDDGLTSTDARKYCVRHLLLVGMTGGGSTTGQFSTHMHSSVSARRIAGYFNAYIEGRDMKQDIKVPDHMSPIKILGSPFNGT